MRTTEHDQSAGTVEETAVEPLLSIADVMAWLRVSRGTVRNLVLRGELSPSFVGDLPRFDPTEVRDFIRRNRRPATLPANEAALVDELRDELDAREVDP
jgi:hypothetical protein